MLFVSSTLALDHRNYCIAPLRESKNIRGLFNSRTLSAIFPYCRCGLPVTINHKLWRRKLIFWWRWFNPTPATPVARLFHFDGASGSRRAPGRRNGATGFGRSAAWLYRLSQRQRHPASRRGHSRTYFLFYHDRRFHKCHVARGLELASRQFQYHFQRFVGCITALRQLWSANSASDASRLFAHA
jgi:hypothetical protein